MKFNPLRSSESLLLLLGLSSKSGDSGVNVSSKMRMHSYGKCSPNLIVGALLIFSVIVLYNYWNVSTINHDLTLKVHSLEQQIISLSKSNDALQSSLDSVRDDKKKLELNLQKEQLSEQEANERISQKEFSIKAVQNDLENAKQESLNCRDEIITLESKIQAKEKEITELKSKVVSLQAQVAEKGNVNERLQKEIKDTKQSLEKEIAKLKLASLKSTAAKPAVEIVAQDDHPPVLMNDPAVPYPRGWMDPGFSAHQPNIHIRTGSLSEKGIINHGLPVIIQDHPSLPRAKARFSVVDPPKSNLVHKELETEMKPDGIAAGVAKQPDTDSDRKGDGAGALQSPSEMEQEGAGVLPIPGQQPQAQQIPPQGNLDAQEDDGDRPLKDDLAQLDDQSPDGALSQKEKESAVVPAPAMKPPSETVANGAGVVGGHSGQDVREAAHNPVGENPHDININNV